MNLLNAAKQLVDIQAPAANRASPEGEQDELASLDRDALVQRCLALAAAEAAAKEEYAALLGESKTIRDDFDSYKASHKLSKKDTDTEMKEEREGFRRAKLELDSQVSSLQGEAQTLQASVGILEQRIAEVERQKAEVEDERTAEVSALTKKLEEWKDRAAADREALRGDNVALKKQLQQAAERVDELELAANLAQHDAQDRAKAAAAAASDGGDPASAEAQASAAPALAAELAEAKAAVAALQGEAAALRSQKKSLEIEAEDSAAELGRLGGVHKKEVEELRWESTAATGRYNEVKGKVEQLQTACATLETRGARLEAELEGKDREARELLRKQEVSFQTEVHALEETATSLRAELAAARGNLAVLGERDGDDGGSGGADAQHAATQEQLTLAQDGLNERSAELDRATTELKLTSERLGACEAELAEARDELSRRQGTLDALRAEAADAAHRVASLDEQGVETLRALQAREEEMEEAERQRHETRHQIAALQSELARREGEVGEAHAGAEEVRRAHAAAKKELAGAAFECEKLKRQVEGCKAEQEASELLDAKREEEVEALRQRLHDRESKMEELLQLKDSLSARLRSQELRLKELEGGVAVGIGAAATSALRSSTAANRSRSQLSRDLAPPSARPSSPSAQRAGGAEGRGLAVFTSNRGRAATLVIVACLWMLLMYHNYSTGSAVNPAHFDMEKVNVHLRSVVEVQEKGLADCRDALKSLQTSAPA
eukprot:Rhum_TRINITY_DN14773_c22_g1::Rhum_TRINITY_DN14773_c22_g1_i1::g.117371::m.117371